MNLKFRILTLILFISVKVNCQLWSLGSFYSERLNERNDDKSIGIYKIKGKIYQIQNNVFFSQEKGKIYENKTNDLVDFMIYDKRYLFVGYYPNTQEQRMMSIPYSIRFLNKLDVIDIEDPSKRWTYKFDKMTSTGHMKSFDPKNGDITYYKYLKAEKK